MGNEGNGCHEGHEGHEEKKVNESDESHGCHEGNEGHEEEGSDESDEGHEGHEGHEEMKIKGFAVVKKGTPLLQEGQGSMASDGIEQETTQMAPVVCLESLY